MRKTTYGRTGLEVSKLGFGVMRLPVVEREDGTETVVFDESTPLLLRALELGINFFDTHHNYHSSQSETAIGLAFEGVDRSSYIVQTKNPTWKELAEGETFRGRLEAGLERIKSDYFDVYFMHSLREKTWESVGDRFIREIGRAREEGLVRHIGFSSHDTPENIMKFIDMGLFEAMLVQYNLLDTVNEEAISHAHERGMGVSIMGPVGGGRLARPSEISGHLPGGSASGPEAALRFAFSNPNINIVCSGMSTIRQVEENVATANIDTPLTDSERSSIAAVIEEKKRLAELYCTGCGYCMPCPNGVNIPRVFEFMNWKRIYGVDEAAGEYYAGLIRKKKDATQCVDCGECEPKCPQKIEIVRQLKESHAALS